MKEINGDLLDLAMQGEFDLIIHGCNCFCAMNGGIAKSIRLQFPEAYKADKQTLIGDPKKLGEFTVAEIIRDKVSFKILNAYTQFDYKGEKEHVDYIAIEKVFLKISCEFKGLRIGYPKIGAGLAGGDWQRISEIIEKALYRENHTLVKFSPHTHNKKSI